MRLIDADALMDDIKRDTKKAIDEGDKAGSFWLGYAAGSVIAQPDIQPEKAQLSSEDATSDTISRQAALEKVRAMQTYKLFMGDDMILVDKAEVQTELMMQPSVHPEPQEGEWINTNPEYKNGFYNNSYYCSECHDYYTTSPHEMKFCPNCGARMKGVKHEAD